MQAKGSSTLVPEKVGFIPEKRGERESFRRRGVPAAWSSPLEKQTGDPGVTSSQPLPKNVVSVKGFSGPNACSRESGSAWGGTFFKSASLGSTWVVAVSFRGERP